MLQHNTRYTRLTKHCFVTRCSLCSDPLLLMVSIMHDIALAQSAVSQPSCSPMSTTDRQTDRVQDSAKIHISVKRFRIAGRRLTAVPRGLADVLGVLSLVEGLV